MVVIRFGKCVAKRTVVYILTILTSDKRETHTKYEDNAIYTKLTL